MLIVVFVGILYSFSLVLERPQTSSNYVPPEPEPSTVLVSDLRGRETSFGNLAITGKLLNQTSRELRGISVQFDLLDVQQNKVGEASDYISRLQSGETWKFSAVCFQKAKAYRLQGVRCGKDWVSVDGRRQ